MTSSFVSRKDELLIYVRQDLEMRHSKSFKYICIFINLLEMQTKVKQICYDQFVFILSFNFDSSLWPRGIGNRMGCNF